jgi:two-component system chemotaxis response regulator CheY
MRASSLSSQVSDGTSVCDSSPPRLLVIDDDPVQQELLSRAASRAGFVTISARSFKEAVRCIKSEAFDCVVLDLNLEDGDGIDLCQEIARTEYTGSILIVSGADARRRSAARYLARLAGMATQCLPKPIDLSSFRICLADLGKGLKDLPVIHEWGGAAVNQTIEGYRN